MSEAGALQLEQALGVLEAGVDAVLDCSPADASRGLVDAIERVEVLRRRLDAVEVGLLAEVAQRHLAGDYGATSVPDLLAQRLRITPREAKARTARVADLGPRRELTGAPLDPVLPGCAHALAAGAVSAAHVAVVAKALDQIPADIAFDASPAAEQFLLHAAEHENPQQLTQSAIALLARLAPDGREPDEDAHHRRREFTLAPCADGGSRPVGYLDPETTAVWQTILSALSSPAPATPDGVGVGAGVGERDPRTAGQRRHDALAEAGQRLLRAGTLPDAGGTPVTVLVTFTADAFADPDGLGRTEHGLLLSSRQIRRLTGGDGAVQPILFDHTGQVLCLGREQRLAPRWLRRALAARDGGCSFPHCTRPASWCQAHHVRPWTLGGRTDIDNLTLLCRYHHQHFEQNGWSVRMIDGLPYWQPPDWLDPDRVPLRNTTNPTSTSPTGPPRASRPRAHSSDHERRSLVLRCDNDVGEGRVPL